MPFSDLDRYKLMQRSTETPVEDLNSLGLVVNDVQSLLHGLEEKDKEWIGKVMGLWWVWEEIYAGHLADDVALSKDSLDQVEEARIEILKLDDEKIKELRG